jgi:putative DNA methylase
MPKEFDPLTIPRDERKDYRYEGPEIIYTFWAKHGPCQVTGCGHRTPIMTSPVMAVKSISVKHWEHTCGHCGGAFHVEEAAARMAPDAPLYVAPSEYPFSVLDARGNVVCPHCQAQITNSITGKKGKNKKIELSLLVHPQWLAGSLKQDAQGQPHGGSAQDDAASTARWNQERASQIRLLEVRGALPEEVTCPETKVTFAPENGTVPKKSHYACAACGTVQDVLTTIKATGKTGPMAAYAVQGYAPKRDAAGKPYSGRFFAAYGTAHAQQYDTAFAEWEARKNDDLKDYWPRSELPYGFMTHHLQGGVPNHGFTHWWTMFNPRQLLVHAQLLKAIVNVGNYDWQVREYVLGAFQQYLRNQSLFTLWNVQGDKLEPQFANNNYHPKSTVVENCVFPALGRGNWASCIEGIIEGCEWAAQPWDSLSIEALKRREPSLAEELSGKSEKVFPGDPVLDVTLHQGSSTDLAQLESGSLDLVITDPPFGGLLHYSELSDFFYVWLRLALKDKYPRFSAPNTRPNHWKPWPTKHANPKTRTVFISEF